MSKLDAKHRGWLDLPQTQQILSLLNDETATTRCVGGCVRDALMGIATAETEVDMATDLPPQEVMSRLKAAKIKTVPTGIKHGTVSAIMYEKDKPLVYEITTLRVDMKTDGRHAEVAFTKDWQGDAARRDFTINALYADADGTLHDPTGAGLADIAAKHVRFIGQAAARIEEDYLRVLRYFRFHFRLTPEADMNADALAACQAAAVPLRALSGERKQQEMLKIMALPSAALAARALHKAGLLRAVLAVDPVDFQMTENMVSLSDDPLLRLMSLLPTPPALAEEAAKVLATALKLSNKQTLRLMKAVEMPLDVARLPAALYFDGAQAVADRALLALASQPQGGAENTSALQAAVKAAQDYVRPKFPLTGAMMQKAGLPNGPEMGAMSKALEHWWVDEGFPDASVVEEELLRRTV